MTKTETVALFWRSLWTRDIKLSSDLLSEVTDPAILLGSRAKNSYFFEKATKTARTRATQPCEGQYPLQYIAQWIGDTQNDEEFFIRIIDGLPSIAAKKDPKGCFSLCQILLKGRLRLKGRAISRLIEACPAAALCNNSGHLLPVECAINNKYPSKVILDLLEESPPTLTSFNKNPLLSFLDNRNSQQQDQEHLAVVIKALLDKYVDCCNLPGDDRPSSEFPLFNAIDQGYAPKIISLILRAYPKAASVRDPGWRGDQSGEYALHKFMRSLLEPGRLPDGSRELIFAFNEAWPDALKVPFQEQNDSKLPLHWSIKNNLPSVIILALMKCYPNGVFIRDTSSSWLPLHYAASGAVEPDVMQALLDAYPGAVDERADKYWQNSYSTAWFRPIDLVQVSLPDDSAKLLFEASTTQNRDKDREEGTNSPTTGGTRASKRSRWN